MAYRAIAIATQNVEGSFKEQYKRIYDYAHELLARNPGSTVKVNVEENKGQPIFKRFYACLKACKDNFISCRPVIGLDGAFLRGKYGGQLLTAIGRDANDQMLPIAYAVVEVENRDSQTWFLELLIEGLGGVAVCASYTFISDKKKVHFNSGSCSYIYMRSTILTYYLFLYQQGLLPAIQELCTELINVSV